MRHLLDDNIALTTSRQAGAIGSETFDAVMAVSAPVDFNFYRRGGEYVFPLYFWAGEESGGETLSPDFRNALDNHFSHHYSPEEIAGYIYSVLHAPTYRRRFGEFLRNDFPRIPFARTRLEFEGLSSLGWALVQAHLLKAPRSPGVRMGDYFGNGDHIVEAVRYSPQEATVWINRTQGFSNVPQGAWDFIIGGYDVLGKYLKSRKGRALDLDEQTHIGEVTESLVFTIAQMARIDDAYLAAFPDGENTVGMLAPSA